MKLLKKNKATKGFTLVELVVVIAVIAILGAVSVAAYFGITESAKKSNADSEQSQLKTALLERTAGLGYDGKIVIAAPRTQGEETDPRLAPKAGDKWYTFNAKYQQTADIKEIFMTLGTEQEYDGTAKEWKDTDTAIAWSKELLVKAISVMSSTSMDARANETKYVVYDANASDHKNSIELLTDVNNAKPKEYSLTKFKFYASNGVSPDKPLEF